MRIIVLSGGSRRRGFTLTELAIVLLVVSLITGAIWVAAEHTWDSYRVTRTNQQVVKLVQNVREYYMSCVQLPPGNCNTITAAAGADITATLDNLGLFPLEMRRNGSGGAGGPIDNPFNANWPGGSLDVQSLGCLGATTVTCMRVRMLGLTQAPCIKLLTFVPVDDAELGIVQAGTQNMAPAASVASPTVPIGASTAETWCNQGGDNNEIDLDFKLRN